MNLKDTIKKITNITSTVLGYGSIFATLTPSDKDDKIIARVADTSTKIADLVLTAQSFREKLALGGEQALQGIAPMSAQVIMQSELLIGKEVVDEVLFAQGVAKVTGGYADILQAIKNK